MDPFCVFDTFIVMIVIKENQIADSDWHGTRTQTLPWVIEEIPLVNVAAQPNGLPPLQGSNSSIVTFIHVAKLYSWLRYLKSFCDL